MKKRCNSCDVELPEIAQHCPFCGRAVAEEAACGAVARAEHPSRAAENVPWEQPGFGLLGGWWATLWESLIHPGRFYARMRPNGSMSIAYHFYYLTTLAAASPVLLLLVFGALIAVGASFAAPAECHGLALAVAGALAALAVALPLLMYVLGWIMVGVSSVIAHISGLLFGARSGFRGTFRMLAYAGGTTLVQALGSLVGLGWIAWIWHTVLVYHGYRRVHGLSAGRAVGAIILPFLACVVLPVALAGGLIVGGVIGLAKAADIPQETRTELRPVAEEIAQAWQAADEEALAEWVPDARVRRKLLDLSPESVRLEEMRRAVWVDRWLVDLPAGEHTYVAMMATHHARGDSVAFIYLRRMEGGWEVVDVWAPPAPCGAGTCRRHRRPL